jgi:hypothetical protein
MDVPAEHEGREARHRQRPEEGAVSRLAEQLRHEDLMKRTREGERKELGFGQRARRGSEGKESLKQGTTLNRLDRGERSGRTAWKASVVRKQCIGLTLGRTAKTVSPTKPRVDEATPAGSIESLSPSRVPSE